MITEKMTTSNMQYRPMKTGEVIQENDEFNLGDGRWRKTQYAGNIALKGYIDAQFATLQLQNLTPTILLRI